MTPVENRETQIREETIAREFLSHLGHSKKIPKNCLVGMAYFFCSEQNSRKVENEIKTALKILEKV